MTTPFNILSSKYVIVGLVVAGAAAFAALASAQVAPSIATTIHTSGHSSTTEAAIGTMVHAEARVASSSGAIPTGTVTFHVYAGTSCNGTDTVHSGVSLVNGVAESSATPVPSNGLSYRVNYSGDSTYAASEGSCTALIASAPDTTLSLGLSTSTIRVGTSVIANATLNNATANASGTVAYTVYNNSGCSANPRNAGTKTVTNGSVPSSDTLEFNTPGTYYWRAVYSGDSLNDDASSACASGRLNVLATSTRPHDGNGNNGKHKGWMLGLPFGILQKVFGELGVSANFFAKWEERFTDEELVDLKVKIREAKETKRDNDDDRKDWKNIREEMRDQAKEMRERAAEYRKDKKDND